VESALVANQKRRPKKFPISEQPPPLARVNDILATNPDFIKVEFHIGRFIITGVDTEKERAVTEALQCNLEFTSKQIKVSISFLLHVTALSLILTPFFFQQLIAHSQSKDQYIRVALKRLTETQILDDELKEERTLNQTLLARNQEIETQLTTEGNEKASKYILCIN
jgi:hypothetical protein